MKKWKILIEKGTETDEKGLYFAIYEHDDTCLGVGKSEKKAVKNLFKEWKSYNNLGMSAKLDMLK